MFFRLCDVSGKAAGEIWNWSLGSERVKTAITRYFDI